MHVIIIQQVLSRSTAFPYGIRPGSSAWPKSWSCDDVTASLRGRQCFADWQQLYRHLPAGCLYRRRPFSDQRSKL